MLIVLEFSFRCLLLVKELLTQISPAFLLGFSLNLLLRLPLLKLSLMWQAALTGRTMVGDRTLPKLPPESPRNICLEMGIESGSVFSLVASSGYYDVREGGRAGDQSSILWEAFPFAR